MNQRFFHGNLSPAQLAQALIAEFNRGNLRAESIGEGDRLAVQIGTRPGVSSGGQTALTVTIETAADGVLIQVGEQTWLGTAASLGRTTMATLMNPWNLLGRLDDLAQDVENMQLTERVLEGDRSVRPSAGRQPTTFRPAEPACLRVLRHRESCRRGLLYRLRRSHGPASTRRLSELRFCCESRRKKMPELWADSSKRTIDADSYTRITASAVPCWALARAAAPDVRQYNPHSGTPPRP